MSAASHEALRAKLNQKKAELTKRLERISANLRRGYDSDSKERAKELEDNEVVDALGNEARAEIAKISAALRRMESGDFGNCTECGMPINEARLHAYPYAEECIECAEFGERRRARR